MIIDATGLVMGRLASVTAKQLLAGDDIKIVNIEKAIITGRRESIYEEYFAARDRGHKERGPYFPRRPEMIMKRTVRGMLPYKLRRGRDALSRLRIYIGIPRDLAGEQFEQPKAAKIRGAVSADFIELGVLSKRLGANF
jgi:large subunit ribosomal protein L13